jgi:hypothetical protein
MFLNTFYITIGGASTDGVKTCYIANATNQPTGEGAPSEAFRIDAAGAVGENPFAFQGWNVRMVQNSENVALNSITPLRLDGNGPDIMVTGQLSACVFVVLQNGNQYDVAHLQPGGLRGTGSVLKTSLEVNGRFTGNAARFTRVFGVGQGCYDEGQRAHVVGVRNGNGAWEIYAQVNNASVGTAVRISNVVRII